MHKFFLTCLLALGLALSLTGCGKVGGPRFWYDDRNQQRLDGYQLPGDPGAPSDFGIERQALPSGEDLSEDDLRDYHTDIDRQEERRKSESSLVDF